MNKIDALAHKPKYNTIAIAIFLILAVVFFLQRSCDAVPTIKGFVAIPTLFAAIATAIKHRTAGWMIPLALLASAAGDWEGAMGDFIMQIAFFALAHLFYIGDFASQIKDFCIKKLLRIAPFLVVMLCVLGYVMLHIDDRVEFYAVGTYGLIISAMGIGAMLQTRARKGYYIMAALLFILSDSLIAYGKFVEPIKGGNTWVMTTYYAAQGIFMTLALKRQTAKE